MVVKLLRSGRLELISFFVLSTVVPWCVMYWIKQGWMHEASSGQLWLTGTLLCLIVSVGLGYWIGKRQQNRIDAVHLALKQAASGNLAARLPEGEGYSLAGAYREFNLMAETLERKLQVMQRQNEIRVLQQAASNEEAVLEERKRLARDLHDTVSQQLFAIHMSASSLPKLLEISPERAGDVMKQLITMSSHAQKQMRGFIAQLRPLELEGRSLEDALARWFPDYCRQNGLQGFLDWRVEEEVSEAKEHQLFLIVQEAMANVVKHAGAGSVTLSLSDTPSSLTLVLQDDGQGFRADQVRPGSYGLSTMQERAMQLGGDAAIISKPGGGTRIRVSLPKYGTEERGEQ
ncbi:MULTISPECIES: sensor histidine kinase [unclassified Paenibacillus]|uniref:sensor histidine kinase n=1 Tax=unclassified Paenibacillus TaxID=185978 RepID=UPI0009569D75|nr:MULTISPECIES: sensor histidine kinase [unclassified Paenibacillus]ASS66623.1 sensor histidine kinase [Paenibacillus sp. RUD330]SIQ00579.1 two-component system, NarL family, sensor histidine kinase LiaS [Paenibacillus sp. RU4X]SIQ19732.1 two-component system, NarL family, sensor histidine kinase LiaS [Paenibacillus sp. RU4T]